MPRHNGSRTKRRRRLCWIPSRAWEVSVHKERVFITAAFPLVLGIRGSFKIDHRLRQSDRSSIIISCRTSYYYVLVMAYFIRRPILCVQQIKCDSHIGRVCCTHVTFTLKQRQVMMNSLCPLYFSLFYVGSFTYDNGSFSQ